MIAVGVSLRQTMTYQLSRCAVAWSRAGGRGVHVALVGPSLWCSHHKEKKFLQNPHLRPLELSGACTMHASVHICSEPEIALSLPQDAQHPQYRQSLVSTPFASRLAARAHLQV